MIKEIIHDIKNIRTVCSYLVEFPDKIQKEDMVKHIKSVCERMKTLQEKLEKLECQDSKSS